MGTFRQTKKANNGNDSAVLRAGYITGAEVSRMEVLFLIDGGGFVMCVSENGQQSGLPVAGEYEAILADGSTKLIKTCTGLDVRVFNRRTLTDVRVLPGNVEPLFGSLPMKAPDVIIDPGAGELKLSPHRLCMPVTIVK